MTTLRGPDPYAEVEERLAALPPGQWSAGCDAEICALLHETIPTYNWVGIYRSGKSGLQPSAWAGPTPPPPLAAASLDARPLVLNDLQPGPDAPIAFHLARAEAIIPFETAGGVAALIVASEHRGAFGPADLDLLRLVTARLGEQAR